MKHLFSVLLLLLITISSFAQFTDTAQLSQFIRDTITDRRPNKITAAQLQKGLLGILQFVPFTTTLTASQVGYGSSNNTLTGNSAFTFNDTTNTLQLQSLQVNGNSAFTGDLNIGSATITSDGSLINTNAILSGHFIPHFHGYRDASPFISKLDDVLYNYNSRLNTATTLNPDNSYTIDILFPPDEVGPSGIVYSGGSMYFSFWSNGLPGSISVMARNAVDNNWYGPYTANSNLDPEDGGLYEVPIGLGNWLIELQITITPLPGGIVNLQDMAYVLDTDNEGLYNPYPYVSKYGDEHIYNYFYLKNGGVDNIRLSPYLSTPNYFLNNVLIGSSTPNGTANLQITGDVTASGNMGIGTATPQYPLDVNGDVNINNGQLRMYSSSSGINATCLSTHLYNGCGSAGFITLGFNNTSGAASGIPDPLTVSQYVMSVGINTINPLAKLHVTGGDTSASSSSFLINNAVGKESLRVLDDGTVRLASLVNDTTQTRMLVSDSAGNLYYRNASMQASASGTYVPSLTGVTNIASSTADTCFWTRCGNIVTVFGSISVLCTALTGDTTIVSLSLPVSTTIAGEFLRGTVQHHTLSYGVITAIIDPDSADDTADILFLANNTSVTTDPIHFNFSFSYVVQ